MNAFYGVLGPAPAASSTRVSPRRSPCAAMRSCARQSVNEAKGYDVIYGDTDSTFVWLSARTAKPGGGDRPRAGQRCQRLVGAGA
nr:hypothetical protein [Klebsiella pneumoniae subsp. pneumoniae]